MDKGESRKTSELLQKMVDDHQEKDTISIGDLKNSLHERGFGVLTAIAALPLCVPLPLPPGWTTIVAMPLIVLSLQMIWGRNSPWLPGCLTRRKVKRTTLAMMVEKSTPMLRRVELLLRPRITRIHIDHWQKIVGSLMFIFSCAALPPIPLVHVFLGAGIVLMSLGLLARDGIMIVIGGITSAAGMVLVGLAIFFGEKIVEKVFG